LAKKLKECGVFGVSSDEYLNYAESNRREWEIQGKEVVAQMSAKCLPPLTEGEEADESWDDEDKANCFAHGLPNCKHCDCNETTKAGPAMKIEDFDDADGSTK
jgi:hypothetical protein